MGLGRVLRGGVVRLLSLLSCAGLTLFSFVMTSIFFGNGKKLTGIGKGFCSNLDELDHVSRNTRCRPREMRKKWPMDNRWGCTDQYYRIVSLPGKGWMGLIRV